MKPSGKREFYDAERLLHRAAPLVLAALSVGMSVTLLRAALGGSSGILGRGTVLLAEALLGRASALLPLAFLVLAFLWRRDVRERRLVGRALYLLAALLLAAALFARLASGTGGLLGGILCRALTVFFGDLGLLAAVVLCFVFYLFVYLDLSVRFPLPPRAEKRGAARSAVPHHEKKGMLNAMKIKPGKTRAADDGGYYPANGGEESYAQIRARLEREEAMNRDLPGDGVVYPDPVRVDIPMDEKPVAPKPAPSGSLSVSREPVGGFAPARARGEVISAAEAFGSPGARVPFTEPEHIPIYSTSAASPDAATLRGMASDAPFVRPEASAPASSASVPLVPPAASAVSGEDEDMTEEEFNAAIALDGDGEVESAEIAAARRQAEAESLAEDAEESADGDAASVFGGEKKLPMDMPAVASRISDAAAPAYSVPTASSAPAVRAPEPTKVEYCFPPLSLLKPSDHRGGSTDEEIKRIASGLLETLESFNVSASISHVSRGPRITRYELIPKRGVRIRNIVNLQDDISMNLASAGIRIEAPIPGLAAVGVEVPNKVPTAVRLRDMLDQEGFRSAQSKTTVCVGSDVTGEPVYGDIAKMPHALIAGATGMGKSVCINAILLSLLFKAHPDEVKLILVDPKKVELNVYNGIPHLLVPVVVEPQKAAGALVWAVGEMERRFNMIETHSVRDIKGYNRIMKEHPELGKPLPQIVIVIDELNDLMMSARDAVEDAICRIAQKARAAGIHLLIGTQRPSVDVITGVIKANIPSRIAFHVSSQVDSRTILDMSGAEKLLNNGDMLFFPVGVPKPIRVQGAFVDDDEVEAVTSFLKRGVDTSTLYDNDVMANIEREAEKCMPKDKRSERAEDDDEMGGGKSDLLSDPQFIAAVEIAINQGFISTSKIQSKLRIGFQKATNFVENMEEMGIVGPHNGSKPRDVLISMAQFNEMRARS